MTEPWAAGASQGVDGKLRPATLDLETLYRDHHRLVAYLVRGRGIPSESVEDVVHEVFIAAHRRRDRCPDDDVRHWLLGVTSSVCHSHRRSAARRKPPGVALPFPAPQPDPQHQLERKSDVEQLEHALEELDPSQREVFVRVELEGVPVTEVAKLAGVKLNTVYSRLRLARRRVDAALAVRDDGLETPRPHAGGVARRSTWAILFAPFHAATASIALVPIATASLAALATLVAWRPVPFAAHEPVSIAAPCFRVQLRLASAPERVLVPRPLVDQALVPGEPTRVEELGGDAPPAADRQPSAVLRRASPSRTADPDSSSRSPLQDETHLLRGAAKAIEAKDQARAQHLLMEHAERFPQGLLRGERARLQRLIYAPDR